MRCSKEKNKIAIPKNNTHPTTLESQATPAGIGLSQVQHSKTKSSRC